MSLIDHSCIVGLLFYSSFCLCVGLPVSVAADILQIYPAETDCTSVSHHLSCTHTHKHLLRSYCICLCPAISAFALAALVLPGSYPHYLDLIHSLSVGPYLLGLAKFGIAFPVSYHTYNGIRHLVSVPVLKIRRFIDFRSVVFFTVTPENR